MRDMIVNGVMRVFGLGKAVDALNGESSKAYLGGVIKILGGVSSIALGVAGVAAQVAACSAGACYANVGQGLFQGNAQTAMILGGVGMIGAGVAAIGQRHALAKAVASGAPAEPPAQNP